MLKVKLTRSAFRVSISGNSSNIVSSWVHTIPFPSYNVCLLSPQVEKEHNKSMEKILKFEKELGSILETNRVLQEDFYREKLLRKRFYNMVEELKGKIRVFCRIRPLAKNEKASDVIAQPSDPYTVSVDTPKGHKEFQFDRVFTPEECQEQVFCDTQVFMCRLVCFDVFIVLALLVKGSHQVSPPSGVVQTGE